MNLFVQKQASYHQKKNRKETMLNEEDRITDTTIGNQMMITILKHTIKKRQNTHLYVVSVEVS